MPKIIPSSDILENNSVNNSFKTRCFILDGNKYAKQLHLSDIIETKGSLYQIYDIILGYHSFSLRNVSSNLVGYLVKKILEPKKAQRSKLTNSIVLKIPKDHSDAEKDDLVYSFGSLWKVKSVPLKSASETHLELVKAPTKTF